MGFWEQESSGTRSGRRTSSARKKGRPSPLKRLRPEEMSLNNHVLLHTYVLMAVTGLGYLALLWSTVVLLGGFVTVLRSKDFWCLTAISMLQASRIFNDFEDILSSNFLELLNNASGCWARIIQNLRKKVDAKELPPCCCAALSWGFVLCLPVIFVITGLVVLIELVYFYGHLVCVVLSAWRIVQRDYGSTDGDGSKANLMPALDIFYSLVLCQGAFLFIWLWLHHGGMWPVVFLLRACKFPEKWGSTAVSEYLLDTRAKCWRDPASIHGRKLIHYAVDLLGSESQRDYLSGARMLDTFIKLDADVRSLVLPSRPKIQKLIDTLGWRSSDREIRELAARIVAYLAGDINLTQFPGAIRCISSLLDTTLPYWNNQHGHNHCSTQIKLKDPINAKDRLIHSVRNIEERRAKKVKAQGGDAQQDEADIPIHGSKGDGWNELILQGMTILEKLAADQHNCTDICRTPGLLPKIMAPLHSETLIQDISINAWADIVNGSLKVVDRLIRVPEWTGRRVHSEISSSKHAVSNLEEILDVGNGNVEELQMRAIEILTELALDMQTNLSSETKENLIKKQLQIFLTDGEPEEHDTKFVKKIRLKVTAAKTLALVCKTATMSALVVREYENIVELLDGKNKIVYRTVAAEILENLCSHHQMNMEHVKTVLLPKLLTEVLNSRREPPTEASQTNVSAPGDDAEHQQLSVLGNDEEKQLSERKSQTKSNDQTVEEQTAMMELQEAFLSLTLVICSKQISADDFNAVALTIVPAEGEFVAKLKTIVEENCEATANSLRIVKLCGQIAVTMLRRGQYSAHFRDKKFVETLSKASTIMSNLESCMLFAGTDCGAKKTARPLLSDLAKEAQALVA